MPPTLPATHATTAQLAAAVKALHASQVVILEALQQPTRAEIEAELWHLMIDLTRSQERILAEVLLGTPLPIEGYEEGHQNGQS